MEFSNDKVRLLFYLYATHFRKATWSGKKFPKVHIKKAGSYNRIQWTTDGYVYTRNSLHKIRQRDRKFLPSKKRKKSIY